MFILNFDNLSVGENLNLCDPNKCKTKKNSKNILVPILASIGGLVLLILIAAAVLIGLKKKKRQGITLYIEYVSLK